MNACVFLRASSNSDNPPWQDPWLARRVTVLDQYALSSMHLNGVRALILTMHQDQRWLLQQRSTLNDFVAAGGTLIVNGQVAYPFASCLSRFQPAPRLSIADYAIKLHHWHPVFDGIDAATLNRRRGVAGFYAHGSNPPPAGASVIASMAAGTLPVDWEIAVGKGRLFVHSGNDLWTSFEHKNANRQFARRLVKWALAEEVAT